MELRPGYKQTEVGIIPQDWRLLRFSELFSFRNGVNADSRAYGKGLRFINVLEVITHSHLHGPEIPGRITLSESTASYYSVRYGDVVFNRTSETQEEVGLCAAYIGSEQVVFGGFTIRARRTDHSLDPVFSGYAMRSSVVRTQIIPLGQGAIRANVGQSSLCLVWLPLPPLSEQRAIAEALGDVDALLLGLDRLIAKKRDLKQAAMQQLLTGKTRLPGFSGDWEVKRLGDLFSFKNGLNKEKSFFGRGIPIVNYMDVFGSSFLMSSFIDGCVDVNSDEIRNFGIKRGDVLFTRTSETANEVGLSSVMLDCPKRMVFSGFLIRAREKEHILHNEYKSYCLRSPVVRAQIVSKASYTTRALTSGRALSSVILPIPQYSEQVAIAEVLSDMDAELMALEARRDKTRLLKQGMMQELLTGRTRLV